MINDATEIVILLTRCGCERPALVPKGVGEYILPLRPSYNVLPFDTGNLPNAQGPVYLSRKFIWQGKQRNAVRVFEEQ